MSKILLIGTELIKAESVIESNVDDKVLSKVIANVQETHLKAILGKQIYESVCNEAKLKVETPSHTIPEPYKEMLTDYIQPFLVWATIADFIAINNYKVSNKGIQKLNDNSSTSISAQEMEGIKNYYDNFVSTYKSNLIKFLGEKKLLSPSADTDITSPAIGWFLEGSRHCGYNYEPLPSNPTTPVEPDEPQDLQSVTDVGNTTGNDIVGIGQVSIGVHNEANSAGVSMNIGEDELPYIQLNKNTSEDKATIRIDNINSDTEFQLPSVGGTFPVTVNGFAADEHGNIEIETGGGSGSQDLQSVTDEGYFTTNDIWLNSDDDDGTALKLLNSGTNENDEPVGPRIEFQKASGSVGIRPANVHTDYDIVLPAYAGGGAANLPLSVNGNEADGVGNIVVPVENFTSVDLTAEEDRIHNFTGHDVTFDSIKKLTIKGGNNIADFVPASEDVYYEFSTGQNWLKIIPLSEDSEGEAGQILKGKFLINGEEHEYIFSYQNPDDGNFFWYLNNIPAIFNDWLTENGGDPETGVNEFLGYTRFLYQASITNIEAELTEYDSSKPFVYRDDNGDLKVALIPAGGSGSYIPLAGTETGSPITGNLEFLNESINKIYKEDEFGNHNSITFWDDPTLTLENKFDDIISQVQLQGSAALTSRDNSTDYHTNLDVSSNRFMVENIGDETVRMRMQEGLIVFNGNITADNQITADRVKVDTSLIVNDSGEYTADFFHNNETGIPTVLFHTQNSDDETSSTFVLRGNYISLGAGVGTTASSITFADGNLDVTGVMKFYNADGLALSITGGSYVGSYNVHGNDTVSTASDLTKYGDGSIVFTSDFDGGFQNSINFNKDGIQVLSSHADSRGLIGLSDYANRITEFDYTQKIYVDREIVKSKPYKVYSAILTQVGTSNPSVLEFENTLDNSITWTRTAVGTFKVSSATGLFSSTPFVLIGAVSATNNLYHSAFEVAGDGTELTFYSKNNTGTLGDGFKYIPVEIRVYN